MELVKSHVATFYPTSAAHFLPGDTIQCVWNGQQLAERTVDFKGYLVQTRCYVMVDRQTNQEDGDYIYNFKVINYNNHGLETLEADG